MRELVPYLSVAIALASLAWTIIVARSKATARKVAALEARVDRKADAAGVIGLDERIDALEDRATKMEGTIDHLPDKDVTHRLELTIGELRAEVKVLSERMKPIAAISDRVQEALLQKVGA